MVPPPKKEKERKKEHCISVPFHCLSELHSFDILKCLTYYEQEIHNEVCCMLPLMHQTERVLYISFFPLSIGSSFF